MLKTCLNRLIPTLLAMALMVAVAQAAEQGQKPGAGCSGCCGAAAPGAKGAIAQDVRKCPECHYCGMNRHSFAYSRMLVRYNDGSAVGTCSLNCTAIDLVVNFKNTPVSFQVGDYQTKKIIDAQKAVWVIGGKKQGVMTDRPKWAFADIKAAQVFIKENGGKVSNFEEVMRIAFEDLYLDTKKTRDRIARQQQRKPLEDNRLSFHATASK
ncbi:MAG: nitrous oxide reductase accessory protein NosL [Syntrophales bacterium]|nr:nitrous oxide reductase accessory protein NosL [Syntrophales bacterium]